MVPLHRHGGVLHRCSPSRDVYRIGVGVDVEAEVGTVVELEIPVRTDVGSVVKYQSVVLIAVGALIEDVPAPQVAAARTRIKQLDPSTVVGISLGDSDIGKIAVGQGVSVGGSIVIGKLSGPVQLGRLDG